MTLKGFLWSVLAVVALWFIAVFLSNFAVRQAALMRKTVTFACDEGKQIGATFYIGDDKFVDLVLSDGRSLSVPHAISASGARYANADESFVFWNKGDGAFITEGLGSEATTTYANCVLTN